MIATSFTYAHQVDFHVDLRIILSLFVSYQKASQQSVSELFILLHLVVGKRLRRRKSNKMLASVMVSSGGQQH